MGASAPILHKMKTIIERLDRRHKGSTHWTHRVEFQRSWQPGDREATIAAFIKTRNELWESFGPGCDRNEVTYLSHTVPEFDAAWGWWLNTDSMTPYIYFKQDKILLWFTLRN